MPIKPENRARYPKDWKAISVAAKERAGWKCAHAGCNARQYSVGRWLSGAGGVLTWTPHADYASDFTYAKQMAAEYSFFLFGDGPVPKGEAPVIVIVLTTAHLDHDPTNCAPENLAPMCQRHHLAYDHEHHQANSYMTRKARANTMELPLDEGVTIYPQGAMK
jgi:hypothetical protein